MPDDAAILFALGRAYAASASIDRGTRGADRAAAADHAAAAAGNAAAAGSASFERKLDAVAARLASLPAGRPLWHHLQGLQLQRQARHREALAAFDAARADQAGTDQPALPGLALATRISRLALGEEAAARMAFERAHEQAPRDAVPLFYLAWLDERAGQLATARQLAEQALSRDPSLGEAHALLGKILLGLRDYPGAVRELAVATSHDPEDASIRYLLAQAYQRAGDPAAAAREFAEARQLKAREVARERQP